MRAFAASSREPSSRSGVTVALTTFFLTFSVLPKFVDVDLAYPEILQIAAPVERAMDAVTVREQQFAAAQKLHRGVAVAAFRVALEKHHAIAFPRFAVVATPPRGALVPALPPRSARARHRTGGHTPLYPLRRGR